VTLPLTIAWRYLRRPTDRLVSAVGIVSILGLVIGVMALVISMALMTGYRGDLQAKLLGGNAEIFVYATDGSIDEPAETIKTIESIDGVAAAAPVIFQYSLVTSEEHAGGEQVMLKGVDPKRRNSSPMLAKIIGTGSPFQTADGLPGVAVGRHLAEKLKVQPGSAITITVPAEGSDALLPRSGVYVVTSVYDTGFFEFDARWIFLSLGEAQALMNAPGKSNLIEVKLGPGANLDAITKEVDRRTEKKYAVTDWRQMNKQLFSLLAIQQLVLFIVIGLIVFVSTFNIVSTLIMTVHEKRKEIGILMTMGADGSFIRRVFIWYGTLVGLIGTGIGIGLGVLACFVITRYELISFGPEIAQVYFVSSIPFVTRVRDLLAIAAFASLVSYLATLVPSLRSARLNVVEALRPQ
jgi:lipoprotein-releasing system permease protein